MDLSPTHIHLLLNHFPTVGFIIGICLFVAALIARSDHLKQASLVLFVGIAMLTIPNATTPRPLKPIVRSASSSEISGLMLRSPQMITALRIPKSASARCNPRNTSMALYAAIPPETPRATFGLVEVA